MKRTERITYYENQMDRIAEANDALAKALEAFEAAEPLCDELAAYLAGKEWKRDFAADEKGLLPKDLRRGVLSEDGAFNVLEEHRALLSQMLKLAAKLV